MSITTKYVLRLNKTLPNGEHPIMLRITQDRKSSFVTVKKSSKISDWDKDSQIAFKSHPQHKNINTLLNSINLKMTFYFSGLEDANASPNVKAIKAIVQKLTGSTKKKATKKLYEFTAEEIASLKASNRLGYAETFQSTLNSLKGFHGEEDIDFSDVALDFLVKYEAYLINRNCAITSRSVYFRTFRTIWRNATKAKLILESHYPFKDFEFSKYNNPRTKKRAITKGQIEKLIAIEIDAKVDTLINSRNYFLFSFYCRGLSFTDLASLKWNNFKDGELNYIRAKTKEQFNFKLHPEAKKIIDYYKDFPFNSDAGHVFPIVYKRHATAQSIRDRKKKILKRVNSDLKVLAGKAGIEKNITTYVARHSYATTLLTNGISREDIGKSLGHDSMKTTEIYLDDIGSSVMDDLINSTL